jgi:hypothetical protein
MSIRSTVMLAIFSVCMMTTLGWIALHSPLVPYNIRELLSGEYPLLSLLLMSCFLYWALGFPVWIAKYLLNLGSRAWFYPGFIMLHAFVAWGFVSNGVPPESIYDMLGSPILGWPWEWELLGRFVALFGVFSMQLIGACVIAAILCEQNKKNKVTAMLYWFGTAIVLLPLMHWIVFTEAATDNLTELISEGGGVVPSLCLMAFLFILSLAGSLIAGQLVKSSWSLRLTSVLWLVLSFPLAYLAISHGMEKTVFKYGQTFSALQFLLSADRTHLAGQEELLIRYVIFHLAVVSLIIFAQYPFWVLNAKRKTPPVLQIS